MPEDLHQQLADAIRAARTKEREVLEGLGEALDRVSDAAKAMDRIKRFLPKLKGTPDG